jgi:mannose/fructose/N-acetylgalactosamine-specific phosphotransferase system component IID
MSVCRRGGVGGEWNFCVWWDLVVMNFKEYEESEGSKTGIDIFKKFRHSRLRRITDEKDALSCDHCGERNPN